MADALGLAAEDGDKEVGAIARKVAPLLDLWEALDDEQRGRTARVRSTSGSSPAGWARL